MALETFVGVVQKTGAGSKPHISCVVFKSERDHGMATMDNRTLGLMPEGTISHSNLSLDLYPLRRLEKGGQSCTQELSGGGLSEGRFLLGL